MDKKALFLFLLIIFSLKYFDGTFGREGIMKNIDYGYMLIAIIISIPYMFKKSGGFIFPIQLICAAILISILMAKYTWGQGFEYSTTTIPYMMWFVFFYLINNHIPISKIESIILIFGIIYIVLFLFQFSHNGTVYFGSQQEFKEDRGVVRINFPGGGVFFLSCFIAINKFTNKELRYKFLWLSYAIIGLVITVMQVTRQVIFVVLIFYMIHFLRNVKFMYKIGTIILFSCTFYIFINSGISISTGLVNQQKEDASAGKDYIRIQAAEYYLTKFNSNAVNKVLGNGFFNDTSNYGKSLILLGENYGYYLTDVGIVEVYIVFGIFAIVGYLIILIKSIVIPVPPNYQYLKYYLWMIMLTSLTSDFLISYNFLIATVLVLCCYQKIYESEKAKQLISSNNQLNLNEIHNRYSSI